MSDINAYMGSYGKFQKILDGMIPVMEKYEQVFIDAQKATDKLVKANDALAKSFKPAIESTDDLTYAQKQLVAQVKDGKFFTDAGLQVDKYGQAITATGEKMGNFNKRTQIISNTVREFAREGRAVPFLEGLTVYLKQGGNSLEYFAEFLSSAREELTVFGIEAAKARKFMYGFLPRGMFRTINQFSSTMQFAGGVIRKTRDNHSGLNEEIERYRKLTKDPIMLLPENAEDLAKIKEILAELEAEQTPSVFGSIFKQLGKLTGFVKKPIKLRFETDVLFERNALRDSLEGVEEETTTAFGKLKKFFRLEPSIEDKRVKAGLKNLFKQITEKSAFKPQALAKAILNPKELKKVIQRPTIFTVNEREEVANIKKTIKIINKTLKGVQYNTPEMKDIIDNTYIKKQEKIIEEANKKIQALGDVGVFDSLEIDEFRNQIKEASRSVTQLEKAQEKLADAESLVMINVTENAKRREKLQKIEELELRNGNLTQKQKARRQKIEQRLASGLIQETRAREALTEVNKEYRKEVENILTSSQEDLDNLNKKGKERFSESVEELKKAGAEYVSAFTGVLPIFNKSSEFGLNIESDLNKATAEVVRLRKEQGNLRANFDPDELLKAERELSNLNKKSITDFKNMSASIKEYNQYLKETDEKISSLNIKPEDMETAIIAYDQYSKKMEEVNAIQQQLDEELIRAGRVGGEPENIEYMKEVLIKAQEEAKKLQEVTDSFGDAEQLSKLTKDAEKFQKAIEKTSSAQKALLKDSNNKALALELEAISKIIKERKKNIKTLEKEISLNEDKIKMANELYKMGTISEEERDDIVNPLTLENEQKKATIESDKEAVAAKEEEKSNAKKMLKELKTMRMGSLKELLSKHKTFKIMFKVLDFFGGLMPALKFLVRGLAMSYLYISLAIIALFLIVKKAWPVISAAFEKAFNIVKPIFELMSYFLGVVFSGVADVLNGFFGEGGLESVIEGLVKIAYGLLGASITFGLAVLSLATAFIVTLSMGLWGKVKDFFSETFTSAKGFFKNVGVLLAMVGVIVAVIAGAPVWLAAVIGVALWYIGNWIAKKISKIFDLDFFAKGGTSSGGLAVVGEEGPELVNLPAGASVYSNKESGQMVGGKTSNNVTNNINVTINAKDTSDNEMRRIADKIGRMINNKINRNVGASSLR